jgi:MFS family permease
VFCISNYIIFDSWSHRKSGESIQNLILPDAKKLETQFEFVALMASLMSVVALAMSALPALDIIGVSIGTTNVVDNQLLITMIFLGLGFGPLVFGPLSDSLGRKPVVYGFCFCLAPVSSV